jgi:methylmalonyl-CoA carboxyltransferase small subunit
MKLEISVDGQRYEVEVEVTEEDDSGRAQDNRPAPATATIQSTVLRTPPKPGASSDPSVDESKLCRSPVAGIVVRVNVERDQHLEVNDLMVVLEAMKMETNVTAPIAGKLKSVNISPRDAVKMNQILVEFE